MGHSGGLRRLRRQGDVCVRRTWMSFTSPRRTRCTLSKVLAALAAGKHVDLREAARHEHGRNRALVSVAAAKQSDRVFAVNYMCRFFPAVLQMRAMVQRGDLGRIIHVQGHFFQDWLLARNRLQLARARQRRRQTPRRRRHRHALDRCRFSSSWARGPSRVFAHARDVSQNSACARRARSRPSRRRIRRRWNRYRRRHRGFRQRAAALRQGAHGFADSVHANAAISQVAAGWKCSLAIGIYGTKGSVQWDLQQPNEILCRPPRRAQPILQRGTPGFD